MNAKRPALALALAAGLAAGCSDLGKPVITPERPPASPPGRAPDAGDPAGNHPDAAGPPPDAWVGLPDVPPAADADPEVLPPGNNLDVVYAHSGSDLFRVNPETMDVERVGPFTITDATGRVRYLNNVTDIAVDRARRIAGLTYTQLLDIDPATGACRVVAPLPMGDRFNGLSWIRSEQGAEQLVASSFDGTMFRIDPATGAAQRIGDLGGGMQSSGDLVSVASHGTLLTVKGTASDQLVRVDPATGTATVIGATGFQKIWGLGFWKNRVFGFTQTGQFILIDPRTGAGTLVRTFPAFPFWGAGVTTAVAVID
jgi:hypothetical protein